MMKSKKNRNALFYRTKLNQFNWIGNINASLHTGLSATQITQIGGSKAYSEGIQACWRKFVNSSTSPLLESMLQMPVHKITPNLCWLTERAIWIFCWNNKSQIPQMEWKQKGIEIGTPVNDPCIDDRAGAYTELTKPHRQCWRWLPNKSSSKAKTTIHKMEQFFCFFFFFFSCLGGCRTTFIAASKTAFTFCKSNFAKQLRVSLGAENIQSVSMNTQLFQFIERSHKTPKGIRIKTWI